MDVAEHTAIRWVFEVFEGPLTYAQSAAGAHGAARLAPVLRDGGDADGAAEACAALLNTDTLV